MALTLTASEAGLEIVDRARKAKGYNKTNAVNWLEAAEVSRSSLDKFWARQPIKHENFVSICAAVGVDWQTVVDESDNSRQPTAHKLDDFNGLKIAKQIHDWLTALRYEFEAHEDLQPEYCEFIIRIPVRRGRFDRILIRGIPSEAKIRDLQALQTSVDKHQTDEGWLIVNRRISPAVQTELAKDENQHLSCMTFDELIDQDADFEPYLTWLEEEVIKRGIDRKYVSLACDKEEIDPVTQHSIATSSYGEAEGWIEGYIKQWLSDDSKEHVSILGEFGTGKTWFSFHYAWECLQAYKEAKEQGLERPRLPLVIALRDYNKALKVESVLSDLFFNKHDIRLNSSVFDCLNQMGKLVIIFDGFDEMADKVDRQKMINNFWELARVVCPGSKVILTSRTEHFPHDRESRQLLNAELESSTAKLKWESPRFELLELAKFNEAQIRHVLTLEAEEKGLSTDIVEKVMVRAELLDLARRPVMTELIIEAMPEIEAGKPVDMSRIYYYAIVRKMDRDIKAERTFTSLADKLYFLCEIAWEMLSTERMKLNYREFPDRIRQIFPQLVTEAKDLDHWHYDMMGQTILIRNADGDYTPAHRSLLEFLVAYKFAAEAGVLKADFVEAVQEQSDCIDRDVMPQDYTWTGYLQACVAAKCEGKKIAPLRGFIPEPSKYLRDTFGHEPLTKAVIDLIVPILEPTNPQPLLDLIHNTKGKTEEQTGWLGGNAATILVQNNTTALERTNLSYAQMANSDLLDANLQGVNFIGTNLTNSIFTSVLSSTVSATAISQDGKLFVTGHDDGKVRIWDAITGQIIHICAEHKFFISSVSIAPDSRWLVSASADKTLKSWNTLTGQCLQTYTGHECLIYTVAIAPDSQWFASGSNDKTIKRWDTITGNCLNTYRGHKYQVNSVAITPDGQWFVSGSSDDTIKRWNTFTGECIHTYEEHSNRINAVAIAPDGQWFISGSSDDTIKRWNTFTGECIHTYTKPRNVVFTVVINSNGQWMVSGNEDKTLKRWNILTGECIQTYTGHKGSIRSVALSPDDRWLISSGSDKTLKCWDVDTGKCLYTYNGYQKSKFTQVAISPDSRWVESESDRTTVQRWDIATGKCIERTLIELMSTDYNLNISSTNKIKQLEHWNKIADNFIHSYTEQEGSTEVLAISPNEDWLISTSHEQTLKRWDIDTGRCLHTYTKHEGQIELVAIAPSGDWFITSRDDNNKILKRWNTLTGKCIQTYTEHEGSINLVAIAPSGDWFITSSGDNNKMLKRWNTSTGKCIQTYDVTLLKTVVISSDSHYIVICMEDEIHVWDVEKRNCIRTISNQPYGGMRIGGAIGLTSGQIESLKALGAVDD
jgi:WD40 repeat protein